MCAKARKAIAIWGLCCMVSQNWVQASIAGNPPLPPQFEIGLMSAMCFASFICSKCAGPLAEGNAGKK